MSLSSFSGKPDPPYNVEVVGDNDLDVDLEWLPGADGKMEITEYTVFAKIQFPDLGWEVMTTTTATSATVSLKPYNTYNFHVTATNAVGTSTLSEMSDSHTTPPKSPIVNPEGVLGSGPEPCLMVVEWDVSVFNVVFCTLS